MVKGQKIHLLIYTYNKARFLKKTLFSLFEKTKTPFRLFILNNGSSDESQRVIDDAQLEYQDIQAISLPVNIGAPAARNWLLSLEEHENCSILGFLDDDLEFSEGWLTPLVQSIEEGLCHVVGPKIVDAEAPYNIQHSGALIRYHEDWINHVSLWGNVEDDGRFDFLSPRDFLMGCVNLYRKEVFQKVGPFDIQFSPSQFDDVDHHLRCRLEGYKVYFHGKVSVRHWRKSGGARSFVHQTNRMRLAKKYSTSQIQRICQLGAMKEFMAIHPWTRR